MKKVILLGFLLGSFFNIMAQRNDSTYNGGNTQIMKDQLFAEAMKAYENKDYDLFWKISPDISDIPEIQAKMAYCYLKGYGVEVNYSEFKKWELKAAEGGNWAAQLIVALYYETGKYGFPHDEAESLKWYLRAGENGKPTGYLNAGLKYIEGKGVPVTWENKVKGFELLKKAYNLAYSKGLKKTIILSAYYLARCYEKGTGTSRSISKAVEYYREAAKEGDEYSQRALKRLGYSW